MNSEGVTGPRKPSLQHLRAYGYKAYTLIKSKGDLDYLGKLQKLAPRAHIGYIVGYESTSIYRVWIPYKKKVISTRDVIFNEREFYNGKPVRVSQELLTSLDETIEQIALPERESLEEVQFQAEEALEIGEGEEPEVAIENLRDIEDLDNQSLGEDDIDNESIALPLRQAGYTTPPLSEKLVQFLENDIIALPVKTLALSQEEQESQSLEDQD